MRTVFLLLLAVAMTAAEVAVSGPFARAMAPSAVNGAVFLTLEGGPDALISATSPVCERVELHTVITLDNGAKRMTPVAEIPVPAVLKPGSYHLMLMGVAKPLSEGDTVSLTVQFKSGSTQQLQVPVLGVAAMAPLAAPEPACCAPAP